MLDHTSNFGQKKAMECECKYLKERFGHLIATISSNKCLEREGQGQGIQVCEAYNVNLERQAFMLFVGSGLYRTKNVPVSELY